ncbi:unnamed protein product, partial [Allacma fusca]
MADSEGSSTSQGVIIMPEQNNPLLDPAAVDGSIEPIKKRIRTDGPGAVISCFTHLLADARLRE